MATPKVQYSYANGSGNTIRPTRTTYPDGRELNLDYGSAGSQGDLLSRVASLIDDDGSTHLADSSYLGLGAPVITDYMQPDVRYTLVGTAGGNDPDTGDIYRGLDRFGRVKDAYWRDYGANADAARIQYGYDRASNRTYRADPVAVANGAQYEELYGYDGLQRLTQMQRGTLNGSHTALTTKSFGQCWTLDPTGNWQGFRQDDNGDSAWDLIQARTSNPVNEITNIANSVGSAWANPAYNAAGNMTTIPQPADPTQSYTATYDAWNRLVKLTDGANTVAEYQYDARNYRTVQKSYSGGVLDETRHFYYTTNWQDIEERVGTSPDSADPDRQFVWGLRYVDDCVLRDRDTNADGTLDERLYALQDGNWNVIALTDTAGDVEERYAYQAYGTPKFLTPGFGNRASSSFEWEIFYCGCRFDSLSGLYIVRNRYLNPLLGTWETRDPIGYRGGINIYQYVDNNPANALDSFGNAVNPQGTRDCETIDLLLKDGYTLDKGTECISLDLNDYLDWRKKQNHRNYGPVSDAFLGQLHRGCIGLCAGLQACKPSKGPYTDFPEEAPNTTCYRTEAAARRQDCPEGSTPFYFAKMGRPHSKDNPWIVPNADGTFNYVTFSAGCYMDMNCGAGFGVPQVIRFCEKHPGPGGHYPAWMWCVTCKPCKK